MRAYFIQENWHPVHPLEFNSLKCSTFTKGFIDLPGHRGHMVKGYISHRPTTGIEEGPDIPSLIFLTLNGGVKLPTSDPDSEIQLHPDIQRRITGDVHPSHQR